jgi:hypothetical protein
MSLPILRLYWIPFRDQGLARCVVKLPIQQTQQLALCWASSDFHPFVNTVLGPKNSVHRRFDPFASDSATVIAVLKTELFF